MSRRQRVWKKFHNKIRQIRKPSLLGAGVLCALAVALLVGGSVRAAVSVSGILRISDVETDMDWGEAEPDDTLVYWHTFNVESDEFEIDNNYDSNHSDSSENVNPENPIAVSVESYNSEIMFDPVISDPELNWTVTENGATIESPSSWSNFREAFPVLYRNQETGIAESITYYRVSTGTQETKDLEDSLAEYYVNHMSEYAQRYSKNIMAAVGGGNYCQDLLESFAQEYNLEQYDQEEGIPLTRDGKAVYQIEMLTVSNLKSQIYVNPFSGARGTFYLDGLLATSHIYTFTYGTDGEGAPVALQEPTVSTASGAEIGSSDSGPISGEEEILLSTTDTEGVYTLQYALESEDNLPDEDLDWQDYSGPFSPGNSSHLYIRSYPAEQDDGTRYVRSNTECIELTYLDTAPGPVASAPAADSEVSAGGTITLTAPAEASESGILYVIGNTDPSLTEISGGERSELDTALSSAGTSSPALVTVRSGQYLYVNDRWYRCPAGAVLAPGGSTPVNVDDLRQEDHLDSVCALAVQEGSEVGDFAEFSWMMKLDTPAESDVTTQSGAAITGTLSQDERILLENTQSQRGSLQYILSETQLDADALGTASWTNYSGSVSLSSVSSNQTAYLYVRCHTLGNNGYTDSDALEVRLGFLDSETAGTVTASPAGGASVDVGDSITLTSSSDSSRILYVFASRMPTLTVLTAEERSSLGLDSQVTEDMGIAAADGQAYLKLNDIWYRCSDSSIQLTDSASLAVAADESLRQDTVIVLYAMAIEEGHELGNFTSFRYYYGMNNQTAAPTSTIATSSDNVTEIQMGETIGLLCTTTGSRIFYTLDGSVPVIDASGSDLAPSGSTREYTSDSPIMVTEDFATYGRTFTITAQAVTYTSYNGGVYRVNEDSEVVRFTYQVSDQAAVETVMSVPATSADSPAEVEAGSSIQLYCNTDGVSIYYTLDGSEPVFDEDTGEVGENTYLYTNGVTVPEPGDNTMFTITAVAYREGLATSALSRLVFRYPSAVSMPYATPTAGSVTENTEVTLQCSTEGAIIYYEIAYGDDTPADPTTESSVFDSENPFRITRRTTIKAFAVSRGMESAVATFTYDVSTKLATPTPSVDTGTTVPSGTRITLEADSGATIYYTLDGSDPKAPDNTKVLVGSSVVLSGEAGNMVVLRTYASRTGYSDSEVGTYSYNISSYDGGIYADVESGSTVRNGDVIHLNTDVSDAVIYYTTDGSTPTENSASGNAVTITGDPGENVIVMAIAIAEGTERSISSATFTYTIMDKLAAPSASVPDGAVFTSEGEVSLTAETGRIYYTTDGTDPTTASNLYRTPILVDESMTLKAIAVADDFEQSDVSTYTYGFADQVATPVANYASGELEVGTTVTFSCETEGATIYYRTDGVDPDPSRVQELEVYTGPIAVSRATTFKVIAVMDHMQDSRILTVGYTVREPEAVLEEEPEETQVITETSGRLQSRRSFSDTESGPSFSGIVLRNAVYGAVVSAEEEVLPENVQLQVERTQVTESVDNMVRQMISDNYGVVAGYDVTLLVDGEEVQPDGEIEIGLPIPVDYENSLIRVIHVQEDGSIEVFDTRRSGGVAYVVTDHLSVYAIAAPTDFQEQTGDFPWLPVIYTAAVVLIGTGVFLLYRSRKMKREGREQDE